MINRFIDLTLEIKIFNNWIKDYQIILEKIITFADLPNNGDIQRKKFSLLTELFLKLCKNRNYEGNFRNISSLILLFLSMYKKNYPVDIFFKKKFRTLETKGDALVIKRILKQELRKTSPTL